MNLDKAKSFFNNLSVHDLPLAAVALGGIILLVLVFKTGKFLMKLLFLLIALGLFAANPEMKRIVKHAAGYATFSQVNVNLLLLATANGYGVVVDNKARKETFMRMGSLGGGVGAGVKEVRVVFVFHDAKVMKQFV